MHNIDTEQQEEPAPRSTAIFLEVVVTAFLALVLLGFFIKFLFF